MLARRRNVWKVNFADGSHEKLATLWDPEKDYVPEAVRVTAEVEFQNPVISVESLGPER